ncbi:MAG TPA: ATP phosphoribosyltransferase regulatory subunit, partial [Candidatus Acidoferrales bacterium]|nr:ATP phosphoribosyltransferase regulatory subunit [Candidatus Acidoferrales bacterium]
MPPDSALWNWFEATARGVMEGYNFAEIRTPIVEETGLFARSIGLTTDVVSKEMFSFEVYESDELLNRRDMVVNWTWDFDQFEVFRPIILRFVESLKDALDHGQIPRDSFNARISTEIMEQAEELRTVHKQYASDIVKRIQAAAGALQIGELVTLRPEATASVCRAYIEHGMHTLPGDVKLYYVGPMFRRERPQKGRYRQFYQIGAEVLGTSDAPAIDAELIEMLTVLIGRCGI